MCVTDGGPYNGVFGDDRMDGDGITAWKVVCTRENVYGVVIGYVTPWARWPVKVAKAEGEREHALYSPGTSGHYFGFHAYARREDAEAILEWYKEQPSFMYGDRPRLAEVKLWDVLQMGRDGTGAFMHNGIVLVGRWMRVERIVEEEDKEV